MPLAAAASPKLAKSKNAKERLRSKIKFIKSNVSFPFRKFYGAMVTDSEEPNAYCAGTHIVATSALMSALNERQLLAVVAHEMAHREKHHLFTRTGTYIGGAVAALLDFQSDRDYAERFGGFIEDYRLRQEMQADCLAYNWLLELKHRGFKTEPRDLNRATNAIFDMDFSQADPDIFGNLPPYIRYKAIERGYGSNCSL